MCCNACNTQVVPDDGAVDSVLVGMRWCRGIVFWDGGYDGR